VPSGNFINRELVVSIHEQQKQTEHDMVAMSLSLKHWIISLDFSWKDDFLGCSSLQESLII